MDTVEIVFAHHHGAHKPGDRVAAAAGEARRLVRGGRANYATKPDALEGDGEAGTERTVAAVKAQAAPAKHARKR